MKSLLNCKCSNQLTSFAPFVLRVAVGAIFVMHGWMKLEGGIGGTAGFLGSLGFPMPAVFAMILIAAEVIGGAFLVLGLYTHLAAKILLVIPVVAFLTFHATKGFFVNAGGYEFVMLIFAATFAVMVLGPGRWSLDSALRKR